RPVGSPPAPAGSRSSGRPDAAAGHQPSRWRRPDRGSTDAASDPGLITASPSPSCHHAAMAAERIEVHRPIAAEPGAIFGVLSDPQGHVAIDSSGMLMSATGDPVAGVGDRFVVHMDREALN